MAVERAEADDRSMFTAAHTDMRLRVLLGLISSTIVLLTAGAFGA